jgi:hypothetical protein
MAFAGTAVGRMLSKNGNRLARFDHLANGLPVGTMLDGEVNTTVSHVSIFSSEEGYSCRDPQCRGLL